MQQEKVNNKVRNQLLVNQHQGVQDDEYDDEDDDLDDGANGGHLIQPIGKQPIEVTMQAVGLGDLSAIHADMQQDQFN